jgi:hypothetical protein
MMSGRHTSVPSELKKTLKRVLPKDAKIVLNDICSCRHKYTPGTVRVTEHTHNTLKLRGYYGSGIANFFVKCADEAEIQGIMTKLNEE